MKFESLLLDTNVLILLFVAQVDPSLLQTFKRVADFRFEDIGALLELMARSKRRLTTPHVLTETSNFADQAPFYRRVALMEALQTFAQEHEEIYSSSRSLAQRGEFGWLGLADTGLLEASHVATVVTRDKNLYAQILSTGREAIYFDHLLSR